MTRTRLRWAGIVVIAVVVYTALIALLVEGNRSGTAMLVMLAALVVCVSILLARGRPLLMVATVVGVLGYTFFAGAATNVVWGREEDPFGPNCDGIEWMNLIMDERCDGGPGPDGHDRFPQGRAPLPPTECFETLAVAGTWGELRDALLADRARGEVASVRRFESGPIDRGALDRGTGREVLRLPPTSGPPNVPVAVGRTLDVRSQLMMIVLNGDLRPSVVARC